MNTSLRKAAQMALDALEHGLPIIEDFGNKKQLQLQHKAITALYESLRARLAQPEPEPVAWVDNRVHGWPDCVVMEPDPPHTSPLYTAPPQRDEAPAKAVEWQGLTDEEIRNLWDGHVVPVFGKNGINPIVFARAIEAKLKEKNR